MINLANDSVVNLYIVPRSKNSKLSAVIDFWNHPVNHIQLQNNVLVTLTLKKEFHVRMPTKSFPCNDEHEEAFYKAGLDFSYLKYAILIYLHFSALVTWQQTPICISQIRIAPMCQVLVGYLMLIALFINT